MEESESIFQDTRCMFNVNESYKDTYVTYTFCNIRKTIKPAKDHGKMVDSSKRSSNEPYGNKGRANLGRTFEVVQFS